MATISEVTATKYRHHLHAEAFDLTAAETPHLTKAQLKAAAQAVEDWYESERATVKAAIDTAVGQTISNALAKKIGKFWMQYKWETE
jgi:hypothetical protein